jgi:hypothetical protein
VGTLEEVLVERIAERYWHLGNPSWPGMSLMQSDLNIADHGLRYQTTINRQFYQAINQLERQQRARRGEYVPAPVNVQLSHDIPGVSRDEISGP